MKDDFIGQYVGSIAKKFSHPETSEMGYRSDFEALIQKIFESIAVKRIDHDARSSQGNKPDFAVYKNDIPILYIEAKDIGISLDKVEKSEQMARYFGYANLVLTDYVEFRFYRNGLAYEEPIKIASYNLKSRTLEAIPENFEHVAKSLLDFAQSHKEPVKSGKHLSKIMGGKAQRIRDNVRQFMSHESENNIPITQVYETIRQLLVHDLSKEAFADMYAQTLVYGLFVARFYDGTPDTFTRSEARDLIPKSNPFLRHFFDHIVGPDFDKRLEYIVNELCEVFTHADVKELMNQYYKKDLWSETHEGPDPVIHFYEDFLKEYDPELRKKLGAFYTPLPVVRFIVRAVDHILEDEFNLPSGLANTSKLPDGKHKVQILDPATGTGTFISAAIRNIYERMSRDGQKGRWPAYVQNDLLPRLHGFELMMAPYTIAHLKLSMAFEKTGFKYFNQKRLGIYLTNSLEESPIQQDLFNGFGLAESIAEESKEASKIKNDTPIMVVIGNPPYSVSSSNKGEWIQNLIKVYKQDLNERKINLDDDYIKFIRFSEHFIEKNKTGIVAMITNNSFIDGITHRQMRKHLLETFDDIYVLNLHGDMRKREKNPDGGTDENVFDIMQGVSISIFIRKKSEKQELGKVFYSELFGVRQNKFQSLDESSMKTIKWRMLDYSKPYYFFVPKDFGLDQEYDKGFKIDKIFRVSNSGVKTDRDSLFIGIDRGVLDSRIQKLFSGDYDDLFKQEFQVQNSGSYRLIEKLNGKSFDENFLQVIQYRPFDYQWIYYDPALISRPADKVMSQIVSKNNIALIASRQFDGGSHFNCYCAKNIADIHATGGQSYVFPIYLYSNDGSITPNLNQEIVDQIDQIVGRVSPEDIFDYIYAVLHLPSYREKYMEFLKIDFPRVPFPKDRGQFDKLVAKGKELRELHLMESPLLNRHTISFPEEGNDKVEKIDFRDGRVYINAIQYFGNVPEIAWNFYIGGYQPAQKWLKDRKSRTLTNEDIEHYQRIIIALTETDRIMKEIDHD